MLVYNWNPACPIQHSQTCLIFHQELTLQLSMSTKLTAKRHKSLGISGLDMTVVSTRRRFQKLWVKSCFCCSLGLAAIPFAFTLSLHLSSRLCFAFTSSERRLEKMQNCYNKEPKTRVPPSTHSALKSGKKWKKFVKSLFTKKICEKVQFGAQQRARKFKKSK